ncbi:hypothetical protein RIF29_01998 [Crotalaria pallida]|uniref:Uncharacterized protein n=1 Tax=Crotalaria pallida TaxID=3830 RepID=A0AAN9IXZ1_CROPI
MKKKSGARAGARGIRALDAPINANPCRTVWTSLAVHLSARIPAPEHRIFCMNSNAPVGPLGHTISALGRVSFLQNVDFPIFDLI